MINVKKWLFVMVKKQLIPSRGGAWSLCAAQQWRPRLLRNACSEYNLLVIKKIDHRARVDLPIFHHKNDLMVPTQARAAGESNMSGGIENSTRVDRARPRKAHISVVQISVLLEAPQALGEGFEEITRRLRLAVDSAARVRASTGVPRMARRRL